jgi:hypothetical protein
MKTFAITTLSVLTLIRCQETIQNNTPQPVEILTLIDTTKVECVLLNHKDEIYNMQFSVKHFDWKNPTSGGAIHITKNDEIEIYQFTLGQWIKREKINKTGDSETYFDRVPEDTSIIVKAKELIQYVSVITYGNSPSVLITSEYDLKESKSLDSILNELNGHVYYLKKK